MKAAETQVKDPVCGIWVDGHQNEIEYLQMHFAFCSPQCQESFMAHPRLYIGYPGQKAPMQEGQEIIKRRRIRLGTRLSSEGELILVDALRAIMGVREIKVDGDLLEISYDLLQVTAVQIEALLGEIGVRLGEGWGDRLRRVFVHDSEEWEIESLEVTPLRHWL